jgi:cellulose biosynthesis protein BcsQ
MNDTRYITKVVKGLLSNIVREEGEEDATSKRVIPTNGTITDTLKRDWGLHDVWNRIITPRFERMNELTKSSDYFKAQACEHFKKLGKKSFSVTRSNAVNALDDAETVLNETEVKLDFIFFDMPGTIKSEGVMKTLSQMDYIFVPVSADRFVVESAMSFMQLFHDNFSTQGWSVTKKLAFFWTMVDKRERTSLYDVYEGMFKSLDYSVLNTRLPDSKRFRRELSENRKAVFRSTIFPSDPNLLRGSGIKELSDEICEIIKT